MYKVKRNGKQMFKTRAFHSYEEARSYVRSYIRKKVKEGVLSKSDFGFFDEVSRNPSNISGAGFSIVKM